MSFSDPFQTSIWLPDIRSGWNTGAFFRTADSLGVEKILLSGLTPYPPHKEIAKTALDAEYFVDWSYFSSHENCIEYLKENNIDLIALELTEDAQELTPDIFSSPCCLVVGNEVSGVPPEILQHAKKTVFIPMKGKKQSMNVSIAGSIAMWEMQKK